MTFLAMAWAGVRHHWRAHLGACVGAALCAMVLSGALLVGDSLQGTLRSQARARVGRVHAALVGGEHFFRSDLAGELSNEAAPALLLRGSVSRGDSGARLNQVQVMGVDSRFWALARAGDRREIQPGDAVVSQALASRLGLAAGDNFVVRIEKPSSFSKDAPLSGEEDSIEALRARVVAIAGDSRFGRFSLQATQVPPATVFLPLEQLQQRLDVKGRANLILSSLEPSRLREVVAEHWAPEDASLELRTLAEDAGFELRSSRVFLSDDLVRSLPIGQPSLTYFVNELRSGELSTPYSMVTAAEPGTLSFLPADLADDEMVVSDWLAEDISLQAGSEVEVKFLVMNSKRQFEERTRRFRVRSVHPLETQGWDGSWMPDFPGLADAGNCREWKPGFALDTTRIRDKDEAYWKKHRGAPKAFISAQTGRHLWGNRWGSATAVRYAGGGEGAVALGAVPKSLTPGASGVQILPLSELATAATDAPVDFAGLFFGFSIFLVAAALALVGLLFGLMVENRGREAGTMLAMGWPVFWVRLLFLSEGTAVASVGSVLGALAGIAYTKGLLSALGGVWKGATGGAEIVFHGKPASLVLSVLGAALAALLAMLWTTRTSWRRPVRELLAGEVSSDAHSSQAGRTRWLKVLSLLCLAPGVWLLLDGIQKRRVDPEAFFSGGSLLLVGFLLLGRVLLGRLSRGSVSAIRHLALRNLGRRPGRSAAVVAVLSSGAFLVLSVQVFQKESPSIPGVRTSGTGGFALTGELAVPVYEDLNQDSVRDSLGLPVGEAGAGVHVMALRVRDGEEASCLNLNRAVQPKLVGVPASEFQKEGVFRFVEKGAAWSALQGTDASGAIPAAVDEDTLQWALQKKVGDEIALPDGRGGQVRVRLAQTLSGSILQGALIVDEANFVRAFPDAGGYRMLLLDAPLERLDSVRNAWSRALEDRGLELRPTVERLAELQAVSNTYLAIFQFLGGLGVLLGAVGVGVVAARNVLERRSELALLEAAGWRRFQVLRLLLIELLLLVLAGLVIGGGCAWLVTVPGQWIRGAQPNVWPLLTALSTLGGVSLVSVISALLLTLRGDTGTLLRRE